jgi:plasmid stability protein
MSVPEHPEREVFMAEVFVRGLDKAVVDQLKARARSSGRSLQAELKLILEEAAQSSRARSSRAGYRTLADEVRATLGDRVQADSAALLAEDRAR